MHGAIRSISRSTFHASAGGSGTSNEFSISIVCRSLRVCRWICWRLIISRLEVVKAIILAQPLEEGLQLTVTSQDD